MDYDYLVWNMFSFSSIGKTQLMDQFAMNDAYLSKGRCEWGKRLWLWLSEFDYVYHPAFNSVFLFPSQDGFLF